MIQFSSAVVKLSKSNWETHFWFRQSQKRLWIGFLLHAVNRIGKRMGVFRGRKRLCQSISFSDWWSKRPWFIQRQLPYFELACHITWKQNFQNQFWYCSKGKREYSHKFFPSYKGNDVIRGYRADDSYFSFASAFINNTISLTQLEKAMMLGNLGEQVVLKSKTAFSKLEFLGSEFAEKKLYYPKN